MTQIVLRCKDKRFPKGEWLLALADNGGVLTDSEDRVRATFTRAKAEGRFRLPSFWESISDLEVRADSGELISFVPNAGSIAQIKTFLHGALAIQGPKAISSIRMKGWLQVVVGICIFVASIVVMVVSMAYAFSNPNGGTYFVTLGAMVVGLVILSRGISDLTKASRAAKKWQDNEPTELERASDLE